MHVFAEMPDIVVGIVHDNLVALRICHKGSIAKVADVVGTALLVKQQIPIDKGVAVVVKIADDIVRVTLADFYGIGRA